MVALFIKIIPFHRSLPADSLLARSVAPSSLPWREAVSPSWLVPGPDFNWRLMRPLSVFRVVLGLWYAHECLSYCKSGWRAQCILSKRAWTRLLKLLASLIPITELKAILVCLKANWAIITASFSGCSSDGLGMPQRTLRTLFPSGCHAQDAISIPSATLIPNRLACGSFRLVVLFTCISQLLLQSPAW